MSRVKTDELARVRRTLWAAADELRANSTMSPAEYRGPVLGLIFLAYAEHRFEQVRPGLEAKATARRPVTADDYRARSVLFVPDAARLSGLVWLPEGENLGKAIDEAMKAVEAANPELRDVLPRGYQRLEKSTLSELLRLFAPLPRQLSGDAFGLIYEDFLSNFAANEGRLGGEFSTPYSIVRLIVEMPSRFGCLPERRTRSGRRSRGRGAGCARGSGRPNAHGTDSCRRSGSPDRASSFGTHRDRGGVSRLRVWSGRNRRPLRRAGGWWGRQERGCPQRRSTARSRYNRGQRLRRRPRPSR